MSVLGEGFNDVDQPRQRGRRATSTLCSRGVKILAKVSLTVLLGRGMPVRRQR